MLSRLTSLFTREQKIEATAAPAEPASFFGGYSASQLLKAGAVGALTIAGYALFKRGGFASNTPTDGDEKNIDKAIARHKEHQVVLAQESDLSTAGTTAGSVSSPTTAFEHLAHFEALELPDLHAETAESSLEGTPNFSGRKLLALPVAPEQQANTYTASIQQSSKGVMLNNGNFVLTWMSDAQDGSAWGIYAQIFSASGVKIGNEFLINTATNGSQSNPHIAALSIGGFVVVWDDLGAGGFMGSAVQILNASGAKIGSQFFVNNYISAQQGSAVPVGLTNGNFAVSWYQLRTDGSGGADVHGQIFNATGTPIGSEFLNTYVSTASYQLSPAITSLANGNFIVTWGNYTANSNWDIWGQIFINSGSAITNQFLVNTYTQDYQYPPRVAALSNGGFVVVWESNLQDGSGYGVYGQILAANGTKIGSEFRANTYTEGDQNSPSVSGLTNGNFVVAWASLNQHKSGYGVYAQIFKADGMRADQEFCLSSYTTSHQFTPDIMSLADGGFVASWTSNLQDGDSYGVFYRLFRSLALQKNVLAIGRNQTLMLTDSMLDASSGGTAADVQFAIASATHAHFELSTNPGTLVTQFSKEQILNGTVCLVHDGSAFLPNITFNVTDGDETLGPLALQTAFLGDEFQVNTYTNGTQINVALGVQSTGSFVVVWNGQGLPYGNPADANVYARLFNAIGSPNSAQFLVDKTLPLPTTQEVPDIGVQPNDGFVVVWSDQREGIFRIYGQCFDAIGIQLGTPFPVSTNTLDIQHAPRIAVQPDGNFIVAWQSVLQAGETQHVNIYARRFNATGSSLGSEFQVNADSLNVQEAISIATQVNGNFIIAWTSHGQNGENPDNYALCFNMTGTKMGAEFLVNAYTDGVQSSPGIATLSMGNFVITWSGIGLASNRSNVYAQMYDVNCSPLGSAFLVNTLINGSGAGQAKISRQVNDNFVITWNQDKSDGGGVDVYAQYFSADSTKLGREFRVNTFTNGTQGWPAVSAQFNNNFVFAWISRDGQDGDGDGIFAEIRSMQELSQSTLNPTAQPSANPSLLPSSRPSNVPSVQPSGSLTAAPSEGPTGMPVAKPTMTPSESPAEAPVAMPSVGPSARPSVIPTGLPSAAPSRPVVQLSNDNSDYTENTFPTAVDSSLTISDADNANLQSAVISIKNFQPGDELVFSNKLGITGIYNSATGMLTLTGSSTIANYQTALRSVAYRNNLENPNTMPRNIGIVVSDGALSSTEVSKIINVIAVEDGPVLIDSAGVIVYTGNVEVVQISPQLVISDMDSNLLQGANVTIIDNFKSGQDFLIFFSQNNIVGSYSAASGILTLSGSSSLANYQAALRSVAYQNAASAPDRIKRTIEFQVHDGVLWSSPIRKDIIFTTISTPKSKSPWEEAQDRIVIAAPSVVGGLALTAFGLWANRRRIEKGWAHEEYRVANLLRHKLRLDLDTVKSGLGMGFIDEVEGMVRHLSQCEYGNLHELIADEKSYAEAERIVVVIARSLKQKVTKRSRLCYDLIPQPPSCWAQYDYPPKLITNNLAFICQRLDEALREDAAVVAGSVELQSISREPLNLPQSDQSMENNLPAGPRQ